MKLVRGEWNAAFLDEADVFPLGEHDDQIDPMCDAINDMLGPRPRGIFGNGVLLAQNDGQVPAGTGAAKLPGPA